jgi:hypothetical protein
MVRSSRELGRQAWLCVGKSDVCALAVSTREYNAPSSARRLAMFLHGGSRGLGASLNASCNDGRRKHHPSNRWSLLGGPASDRIEFYGTQGGLGAIHFVLGAVFGSLLNWDVRDVDRECKASLRQRALRRWNRRMQTAASSNKCENSLGFARPRSHEHFRCDHALQYRGRQNR